MLQDSAILSTFIKLPFVFKTIVLSIIESPLKTGFTVIWFSHDMAGFMVLLLENRMFINVRQLE